MPATESSKRVSMRSAFFGDGVDAREARDCLVFCRWSDMTTRAGHKNYRVSGFV